MYCADYDTSISYQASALSIFNLSSLSQPYADDVSLSISSSTAAAAPAPGPLSLLIPPPAQVDGTPRPLRWLAQYERLLRFQLVGHCHKNRLDVIAVSSTAVPVSLAARVLRRRLEQGHGVGVGKLLCQIRAHLDGVLEVTLVSN